MYSAGKRASAFQASGLLLAFVAALISAEPAQAFENFTGFTRLNQLGQSPSHDPFRECLI